MTLFFADGLELSHLLGNTIALISGMSFAALAIALRKQKDGSPVESIILGNVIAFLVGLPWITTAPALTGSGWTALLLLGVVQLGCSYWFYARAIKHVTALEALLVPVIEPVLNPIWVLLVFGEKPTPLALAGGMIVITAITVRSLISIRDRRHAQVAG